MELIQKIEQQDLVLVYFSFPDCNVCVSLLPKVKEVAEGFECPFLYVNTKEYLAVSGQYMVFAVPTVVLFKKGRELNRWSRVFSVQDVENALQRLNELS